eukprot:1389396-Prymnesium_polylepis.1
MRFGRGRGRHVRAAWGHGSICMCGTGGRAVRPRQMLCGAASHEHILHVQTTAAWSDPTAETCGSIGGTLGSRRMSTVQ